MATNSASNTYYYIVAGHAFSLTLAQADELNDQLQQYAPFKAAEAVEPLFALTVGYERPDLSALTVDMRQDDDGSEIVAGRLDSRPCFVYSLYGQPSAVLLADGDDYRQALLWAPRHRLFGLNNALMTLFALATARLDTLLMHASVVVSQGAAYLFLGKSGTGKSTHANLWLQNIEDTQLLNDDNPVIRLADGPQGEARVYGSPWSGKTPCYRNRHHPIGAIVALDQAPQNLVRPMKGLEAYAVLLAATSGMRWDKRLADGLHHTSNRLIALTPFYHLDCLPDADAARVCHSCVAPHAEAADGRKTVNNEALIGEVAQMLAEGRQVVLPVKGASMLPFIVGGKESVVLAQCDRPAVGDAVLAWVDGSRYVLHRVVGATADGELTLMGDGNLGLTERCHASDVVGKATHVVSPDGTRHPLYTPRRRAAWRLWQWMLPVRRWPLAVIRRLPTTKPTDI